MHSWRDCTGNDCDYCFVEAGQEAATKQIDIAKQALRTISEQGGDIVEPWSAEIARRALYTIDNNYGTK
jgi:hypothetical protein